MEFDGDKSMIFDETFAPHYELGRGIHFRMVDAKSGERLSCLVTTEALHDRAAARGMKEDDVMATFHAFRGDIGGAALDAFASGSNPPLVTTKRLN